MLPADANGRLAGDHEKRLRDLEGGQVARSIL